MDYRQLDGTSTTAATDSPITDQKLSKSRHDARIPDHCGWAARGRWKEAYAAACDEITHMKAERDELAANSERLHRQMQNISRHRDEVEAASAAREIAMRDRAANRDRIERLLKSYHLTETIDEDGIGFPLIDALSCAHPTVLEGEKEVFMLADHICGDILDLPLSPDGQQALDDVRAEEWDAGWMCRYNGGHYSDNPHRKPSDAGKSEDRG